MIEKILQVLGCLSVVRYVNNVEGSDANARSFVISIEKSKMDDFALLQHEKAHVGQFWLAWIFFALVVFALWLSPVELHPAFSLFGSATHAILKEISNSYKQYIVITAHRVQLKYCENKPAALEWMISHIYENYEVYLDEEEIRRRLTK